MSHDASWGIVAKLGTRAIQRRWLGAHAIYGCWIMHEITLIGGPVTSGRDYQPISSTCGATVPTVIPMLLSNAPILLRWHVAGIWSRSEDTLEECNHVAFCPSVFKALSNCSMCHEQLSLSHRPSLQSLTSVVFGEMLHRSETYPLRLVSSTLVLNRGMKNCLQATSWRTRIHSCPVLVSWQQILLDSCNGCGGSASKIDDAWVQFRFCARHFVPMVPPAVIKIRMRPTHKGRGNDAVGRVTLPKWCRKKGDLRRVESQVSKL